MFMMEKETEQGNGPKAWPGKVGVLRMGAPRKARGLSSSGSGCPSEPVFTGSLRVS